MRMTLQSHWHLEAVAVTRTDKNRWFYIEKHNIKISNAPIPGVQTMDKRKPSFVNAFDPQMIFRLIYNRNS